MSSPKLIVKAETDKYETLFHRHAANPILTGKDWPYSINSVFNAGATLLPDGSTLLLAGWKIGVGSRTFASPAP